MNNLTQILSGFIVVAFGICGISVLLVFYFSIKTMIIAMKINPDLAEKAYFGHIFERAKNFSKMNALLSATNLKFANAKKIADFVIKLFAVSFMIVIFLAALLVFTT